MTPDQRSAFRHSGYLRLEGALDRPRVDGLRRAILSELKKLGIGVSGKAIHNPLRSLPVFQQVVRLSGMVRVPDLHARIATPALCSAMTALAGTRLVSGNDAQLLLSPPRQGDWTMQGLNWHTDVSALPDGRLPGIQLFVLIDDVQPQGGGTMAIAGSHRVPSIRDLRARLRHDGDIEPMLAANDLSLLEMTGRAGDAYLMDLRLLHTPTINASERPRMMATARYLAGA